MTCMRLFSSLTPDLLDSARRAPPVLLMALALAGPAAPVVARDNAVGSGSTAAGSGEPGSTEGIPVPKRSRVAGLASSEALENQGNLQYRQLLEQASAKRALAPADHPQRQRLIRIARNLLPFTERFSPRAREWKWEVNLIASNTINAFVMPGGKVVFFTGIIERLKLTDDEIAMIMGHEMAHALLDSALVDYGASGCELVTHAQIVEEACHFLVILAALDVACNQFGKRGKLGEVELVGRIPASALGIFAKICALGHNKDWRGGVGVHANLMGCAHGCGFNLRLLD